MSRVSVPSTVRGAAVSRAKKKKRESDVDNVVERVDAVLLAVEGAARLAWTAEDGTSTQAVTVEVAAILDLVAEKLNELSRELAGSKEV